MDTLLKGVILNHTINTFNLNPLGEENILRVTTDFSVVYKYKSPSKRWRDRATRKKFLHRFRAPVFVTLVPVSETPGSDPWSRPVSRSQTDPAQSSANDLRKALNKLDYMQAIVSFPVEFSDLSVSDIVRHSSTAR